MALASFGYFGVHSDKLSDWENYGQNLLGLELVDKTSTTLKFRMDDRKQRIIVSSDPEIVDTFGWEVNSPGELDAIAARVEAAKNSGQPRFHCRCRPSRSDRSDPISMILPEIASRCSAGQRSHLHRCGRDAPISGFRTGPFGMGHAVLHVKSVDDVQWFYMDVLGFRVSDFIKHPFRAYFFHLNGRHHSLALIEGGKRKIHHIMMELNNIDDVGQGYDLALAEPASHRHHARSPHQRFHDVVLRDDAIRFLRRIWMGWSGDRSRNLAAERGALRAEPMGPRSELVAGGSACRSPCHSRASCARWFASSSASRRRQLPQRRLRLRVVGSRKGHDAIVATI